MERSNLILFSLIGILIIGMIIFNPNTKTTGQPIRELQTTSRQRCTIDEFGNSNCQSAGKTACRILTVQDGNEFIGQDTADPDWIWSLYNLNQGIIGIENDFVKNDDTDDPAGVGEAYTLPYGYAKIMFDQ